MEHRLWYSVAISVAIMGISLSCALFVRRYVHERTRGSQMVNSEFDASRQMCLPKYMLRNGTYNAAAMEALSTSIVEGKEMFCASNSEQATTLMQAVMSATDYTAAAADESFKTASAESFSISKASAHVQLLAATSTDKNEITFMEGENMILRFNSIPVDPKTEHVRNVEVQPTDMVIKEPGMYFIYSNIFFQPVIKKKCKEFTKQVWEHNICLTRKDNIAQSGRIFNATYKCCDECINNKETSYIGGSLDLQVNDRLHVEVSSDDVVFFNKEGSYFGLYMLN